MKLPSFSKNYDVSNSIQKGLEDFHKESGYRVVHIDEKEKIVFIEPVKHKPRRSIYNKLSRAIGSLFS
jgi:hypothetical protein